MKYGVNKNIETGIKSFTVLAGITAIFLFGFAYVIVGQSVNERGSEPSAFCKIYIPNSDGSMSHSAPIDSGKSFFLSIPAIILGHNLDSGRPFVKSLKCTAVGRMDLGRFIRLSTAALVSSRKALEFTLIGAKPSGTS